MRCPRADECDEWYFAARFSQDLSVALYMRETEESDSQSSLFRLADHVKHHWATVNNDNLLCWE